VTGWLLVAVAVVFVATAAILSAVEAAYLALSRAEAERLTEDGARPRLASILQDPVRHTRAVRFWRIWFEAAAGVATALAFVGWLDSVWWAGLWATLTMAALGFVVVGASPRRIGRAHAGAVAAATAALVRAGTVVLGPVPGWLVRLVTPASASTEEATFFTEEHFRDLVDRANEAKVLEDVEADLIHSVFDLGDTRVRAVMVPRTDMITVGHDVSVKKALRLSLRSGCSRLPVIGEDTDDIRGAVYLKDLARLSLEEGRGEDPVAGACRPVRYVPESKLVSELLQELQREATHLAIVVDEYGGTAGLVTLEDLLEEIVGEIDDEFDAERAEVQPLGNESFLVPAGLDIDDLGDLFGEELHDDEVDTVGGLLAKAISRVPIVGSHTVVGDLELRAESLSGRRNRVGTIRVTRVTPRATSPENPAEQEPRS
jgi:CBS domain containing-hemolysin-like protein